jgi:ATP-dependent Clp protease ATP-binding subunit ClpA
MSRLIQDTIRKALADELLFGRLVGGGKVTVDLKTDEAGEDKVVLEFLEGEGPKPQASEPEETVA